MADNWEQISDASVPFGPDVRSLKLALEFSAAADDANASPKEREGAMLLSVAEGHYADEQYDQAYESAESAMRIFSELSDSLSSVNAIRILVAVYQSRRDYASAEKLIKQKLQLFQSNGDNVGEACMMLSLTETYMFVRKNRRKMEEVLDAGLTAREMFKSLGDRGGEANVCAALVGVYYRLHDSKNMTKMAMSSLTLFRALGDRWGEARGLHGVAVANHTMYKCEEALKQALKAKAIFKEIGDDRNEAWEMIAVAEYYMGCEKWDEMFNTAAAGAKMLREKKLYNREASCICLMMMAHIIRKEYDEASELGQESLDRMQEGSCKRGEAEILEVMFDLSVAVASTATVPEVPEQDPEDPDAVPEAPGMPEPDFGSAKEAVNLYMEMNDIQAAFLLMKMATTYLSMGQLDQAQETINKAIGIFTGAEDVAGEAWCYLDVLFQMHMTVGDLDSAMQVAQQAKSNFKDEKDMKGYASALFAIHQAQAEADQFEEAVSCLKEARGIFQALGETRLTVQTLYALAACSLQIDMPEDAARYARDGQSMCQKMKDPFWDYRMLTFMAECTLAMLQKQKDTGKYQLNKRAFKAEWTRASTAVESALSQAKALGVDTYIGSAQCTSSEVYLMEEMLQEAVTAAKEGYDAYEKANNENGQLRALLLKAQTEVQMKDNANAYEDANKALQLAQRLQDKEMEDKAMGILGKVQAPASAMGMMTPDMMMMQQQQMMMMQQQQQQGVMQAMPQMAQSIVEEAAGKVLMNPAQISANISDMLQELIGVEGIGLDTPFMDAGLDSLLSIQFRTQLQQQFSGMNLPSTLTFDYPTVQAITNLIMEKQEEDD